LNTYLKNKRFIPLILIFCSNIIFSANLEYNNHDSLNKNFFSISFIHKTYSNFLNLNSLINLTLFQKFNTNDFKNIKLKENNYFLSNNYTFLKFSLSKFPCINSNIKFEFGNYNFLFLNGNKNIAKFLLFGNKEFLGKKIYLNLLHYAYNFYYIKSNYECFLNVNDALIINPSISLGLNIFNKYTNFYLYNSEIETDSLGTKIIFNLKGNYFAKPKNKSNNFGLISTMALNFYIKNLDLNIFLSAKDISLIFFNNKNFSQNIDTTIVYEGINIKIDGNQIIIPNPLNLDSIINIDKTSIKKTKINLLPFQLSLEIIKNFNKHLAGISIETYTKINQKLPFLNFIYGYDLNKTYSIYTEIGYSSISLLFSKVGIQYKSKKFDLFSQLIIPVNFIIGEQIYSIGIWIQCHWKI